MCELVLRVFKQGNIAVFHSLFGEKLQQLFVSINIHLHDWAVPQPPFTQQNPTQLQKQGIGPNDLIGYVFDSVVDHNRRMDKGLAIRFKVSQECTKKNQASFWSDMLKHKIYMDILECVSIKTL